MKKITLITFAVSCLTLGTSAFAKISPEQAATLSTELTPLGAVRAGNEDGSIPAWTGGITTPPTGYKVGQHHPDPYPDDKILYTITKDNVEQYQDLLSPGQIALFDAYPKTYKMHVYQT